MSTFNKLFSPLKLGKQTIKNRIFLAPMGDNMANPDGSIGEQYIAYYAERAKGGAAVITPGVVSVHYPTGKTIVSQARLDSVNYIKGFAELATQVHRYGALLIPQIHHAGGQTWSLTTHGEEPWCVTEKESTEHALMAPYLSLGKQHEMSIDEIHELVQRFIATATFAQMAGCDGVEVHCAHGYLVNQFFSPETNQRTDEYGGSLENRMRFGREIIEGIRNACGSDFIIAARIPGYETVSNGLSQEDLITIAQTMEKAGCDYLHVSCGCVTKFSQLEETLAYEQGWRAPYAAEIKKNVSIPVVAVGAIREPEVAERLLEENLCDGVALGRTLLADPYFGEKARTGRANEIRRCISCMDGCMGNLGLNRAVCCTLNPEVGHDELREAGIEARIIGDAKKPAKIMDAVHAGFWGAVTI